MNTDTLRAIARAALTETPPPLTVSSEDQELLGWPDCTRCGEAPADYLLSEAVHWCRACWLASQLDLIAEETT